MNTGISFFNSVNSALCRPLLDWQFLTPESTFGLLVDKVGGMTFWKQISQAFLTLSFSLFSTFRFFLALFLRATLHYPHAWNRLCIKSFPWTRHVSTSKGKRSRFRHISVITFPFFLFSVTFPVKSPGGHLGIFLGGYVPPGTPNWHPVLQKIPPKIDTPF